MPGLVHSILISFKFQLNKPTPFKKILIEYFLNPFQEGMGSLPILNISYGQRRKNFKHQLAFWKEDIPTCEKE